MSDPLEIVRLTVTENETGIYLDSNQGWIVEVVHWPRSPARLKRDDAREVAGKLARLWNEDAALRAALRQAEEALRDSAAHMKSLAQHLSSGADSNALFMRAAQARAAIAAIEALEVTA